MWPRVEIELNWQPRSDFGTISMVIFSDTFAVVYLSGFLLFVVFVLVETRRRLLSDDSGLAKSRLMVGACQRCGYNLHRNPSGVRPECGTPALDGSDLQVPGKLTCFVCGKLLGWEDRENNGVMSLPVVSFPSGEPMQKYSGLQVHRSCWMRWPHRERFAKLAESGVD